MPPRLAEVAAQVGVSEATVSRVLNGKPGVSELTRDAVLTALDVLGYERPTKLRGERARLVGLVLPELQNPIFPAFAEVVSGALATHGFTPVLCIQTAGVSEADYVELLLSQQVSGIVFAGGSYAQRRAEHAHLQLLVDRRLPVVLMNASIDGLPFARVACDDEAAVEQSLTHLASLGHREIGLILGPVDHVPSERKLHSARTVAERLGLTIDDRRTARASFSLAGGQAAATGLLREGVTAIVAASDPLALGAIRAARRAGLRVPADLSVVGYDDSAFMHLTDPPLTTVRQPIDSMGRAAIDLLIAQTTGGATPHDELLFEPELVVRSSTGPARAS